MSVSRSLLALIIAVGLTTACHSKTPPAVPPPAPPSAAPAPLGTPPPPPPRPATPAPASTPSASPTADELFARESLDQLNSQHPLSDAFFDYDSSALRDDARTVLKTDAAWLEKWRTTAIRVDGHCDERGTAEYNLALGQRRAQAVQAYLVSLGVDSKRILVNSLGKESPFCTSANNDSCWSQNRRGHFSVTAK
jgi:peptidoglycan-associated lipoprotein